MKTSNTASFLTRPVQKPASFKTRMTRCRRALLALLCATVPAVSPANAAAWCDGKVTHMLTGKAGELIVLPEFRGDWIMLCNVEVAWKDVSPTTCSSWTSTIMAAIAAGKTVTIQYADPVTVCSTVPSYASAPSPNYVALVR